MFKNVVLVAENNQTDVVQMHTSADEWGSRVERGGSWSGCVFQLNMNFIIIIDNNYRPSPLTGPANIYFLGWRARKHTIRNPNQFQ